MTDNTPTQPFDFQAFIEDPAKAEERLQKLAAAARQILATEEKEKQTVQLAGVRQQYETERGQIMQAGLPVGTRIEKLSDLKTRFRAQGLDV